MDIYNTKINNYFNTIPQRQYLFEITKCCEYSEIIPTYKTANLTDLYKNILNQFYNNQNNPIELFVTKNGGQDKLVIPNDSNILLREFINMNHTFFVPIYPLPATVVYRIYFDDGHLHTHDT